MTNGLTKTDIIDNAKESASKGIECWLSWQNRTDELRLPITPFYELVKPKNNQTVNLYQLGDVNLPGSRGLRSMELTSFFPHKGHNYSFCPRDTEEPYSYCRLIDKWQADKYPIRVIFTNTTINIAMMIESFTYGEPDRTRDVSFRLSLKEYRFIDEPAPATALATTYENAVAKSHGDKGWTVQYGDTLTGIAIAKYGDASYVNKLIEWNKDLIKDPHSLRGIAGQSIHVEAPENVG